MYSFVAARCNYSLVNDVGYRIPDDSITAHTLYSFHACQVQWIRLPFDDPLDRQYCAGEASTLNVNGFYIASRHIPVA